ncbi:methylmalonyl-CoA mutase C-terminal domain-containing protein [Sporobacter termitidis DSM 10068]|uniref:Methylmalonyl-CoA mutase C-terminal domain-containing protein n=1 Tax=Sporobacter termitidis DSM 10068 TaxID=1123282 RepID=A0A1M5Z281_9FIRM|nr:cobalamin-dependent protein [Sporobacter termitidis]SHI18356.1 methylmalonyl-CoA mutase C-terminal domain-containing protein [Sporobacter termitidis DSM 10068]
MEKKLGQVLVDSMRDLDELRVLQSSVELVSAGVSSYEIFERLIEGLRQVDARYESGEYFIADLIMAGHIMKSVMTKVLVFHGFEEFSSFGRVVMATVRGDIHELGKNVIADVLRHNGFEVTDLGTDVPPERIVEEVRAQSPNILILSGMIASSPVRMAESIAALRDAGLRGQVRVIVGGAAVTSEAAEAMGADAYSAGVKDCLKVCHEFMALTAGES